MKGKFLPYKADLYTISCVFLFLYVLVAPFHLDLPVYLYPVWIIGACLLSFCVNLINHNHSHVPTFGPAWANVIFELLLTMSRGASALFIQVIHGQHHRYEGRPEDWFYPGNEGKGSVLRQLLGYILTTARRFKREGASDFKKMSANWRRVKRIESVVLILWIGSLLWLDWKKFLIFVLVPWLFGNFFLVLTNLFFHKYADPEDKMNNSLNFLNPIENRIFFNGGFHTIHHLQPNIHWSQLPENHHRLIAPRIRREFVKGSMFAYFINHFLFKKTG